MILVGRYLSPFVRRVGISLTLAGLKFDRPIISALQEQDKPRKVNPEGRYKRLEAHARKMEKLPAFKACQPEQL